MSEVKGTMNGGNGNQEPEKVGILTRVKTGWHNFAAKHPKLSKIPKWTLRVATVGGAYYLGRKSVKNTVVTVTPIEPEALPEGETPAEEEKAN